MNSCWSWLSVVLSLLSWLLAALVPSQFLKAAGAAAATAATAAAAAVHHADVLLSFVHVINA